MFFKNLNHVTSQQYHIVRTIVGHRATDGRTEVEGAGNGVAKGAKVAFIDIGRSDGGLSLPRNSEDLLNTGGDRTFIHSASWGATVNTYDSMSRNIDRYYYENTNKLMIVAAGNNGSGNAPRTILSPGLAKNVLTGELLHSILLQHLLYQLTPNKNNICIYFVWYRRSRYRDCRLISQISRI